ncbi:hypothetical protein ASZ90_017298 [hydrocarbon metagenome]|uniref:Uncharacterized protein n=1 Tax=hydrocarbon metagenome TaxID=938273 RepID=A0A0W8E9I8_9ZZZZ
MKRFRDERGSIVSVLILLTIPVFVWAILITLDHSSAIGSSDINLQQAVTQGVRAGTMCVNKTSQAYNEPLVEADTAHMIFRQILARNLGLDSITLEPLERSGIKAVPEYTFIVYNGLDNPYGVIPAIKYSNYDQDGTLIEYNGFPQDFAIYTDDIVLGSSDLTTTLDSPGCVAVVKVTVPNIGPGETETVRWAAAKIFNK